MNKIYTILFALLAVACAKHERGFVLEGEIKGTAPEKLVLSYTDSLGHYRTNTAAVSGGRFRFRSGIAEPTMAMLSTGTTYTYGDSCYTRLWLEPAAMHFEATGSNLKAYTLTGSATDSEAQELNRRLSSVSARIQALRNGTDQSTTDKEIADEIRKLRAGSPGAVATLFSATDIGGETFNLADLRGKSSCWTSGPPGAHPAALPTPTSKPSTPNTTKKA